MCSEGKRLLVAYTPHSPDVDKENIRRHVEDCEECLAFWDELGDDEGDPEGEDSDDESDDEGDDEGDEDLDDDGEDA